MPSQKPSVHSPVKIKRLLPDNRFFWRTFLFDTPLFLDPALGGNLLFLDEYCQQYRRRFGRGGNAMFLERRDENVITHSHLPQADFTVKINRRRTAKEDQPFAFVVIAPVSVVGQNNVFNADMARPQNRLAFGCLKQIRGHSLGCGDLAFPFQFPSAFHSHISYRYFFACPIPENFSLTRL